MKGAKHCKMIYRFNGMKQAYQFEELLKRLNVPGSAMRSERLGWHVETDSRCLEHATTLAPFIYRVKP